MTQEDDETHPPSRVGIPAEKRFELIERDLRSHARALTGIVDGGKKFTGEQLDQMRTLLREELADVGLRIDGPDHVDDARRDFMFLRTMRNGVNGLTSKIGWAVILAILGAGIWLFTAGLNFWKTH